MSVICYKDFDIVYISSTIVWLLSVVFAVMFSLERAPLKDKDSTSVDLMIVTINTIAWATVMTNVGYPWWPPFAFTLLMWLFIVELMHD